MRPKFFMLNHNFVRASRHIHTHRTHHHFWQMALRRNDDFWPLFPLSHTLCFPTHSLQKRSLCEVNRLGKHRCDAGYESAAEPNIKAVSFQRAFKWPNIDGTHFSRKYFGVAKCERMPNQIPTFADDWDDDDLQVLELSFRWQLYW